ncbi:hypothetical protein EN962_22840 [Mesorhizobium sp. M7A.F.Ca.CA.001.09.2.1]|uniref:Restriction endonuclease n=1 Tax=Mesorhizobium ciceri TaxID=39645 RepID=A0AB38TIW0_9HYPH|nr:MULTISPECIES: hypothetical protein [Mesorhizobium]RUY54520.1 hypothetical protein EN981_08040 [Mesorhizobium sp. M7A.F.Ca.CA.001.13.2.1]MDF3212484.1 hypothetical protein [Mesorhizobium ciceri]RUY64450.1 hypothetical protein EN980_25340 [Mesorhizobium sp. M7A.F.Ca.CA.001.13.1.1]RUY66760.1 hypothetical protein EN965_16625 [Mesorhizobium sp. M7A.F.Ca.CA.001.05.1.1]RUY75561.1 hypothetical protein EN962_22840 [Mesorhizobium sp. M7A.F.Ca.CA.001.09.2.1]
MVDLPILGGVSPEEIERIAQTVGTPTVAGASLTTRFFRRVSALVATRAGRGESGQFTVFLQSEALFEDAKCCSVAEAPLLANGADPVVDRIWLSTASLSTSFELLLRWSDAASLFQAVKKAGLGGIPAVVVDWRTGVPQGRLYRSGLSNHEDSETVFFEDVPITRMQMKEVLDTFYERSLRTPALVIEGHAKRVWKESANGIPEHRPEEVIQGRLLEALKAVFARHDLRAEPITDDGRADIVISMKTITSGGLPAVVNEWVLELKALADQTNTGNPVPPSVAVQAIQSGLEQAIGYKTRLNALQAALCCYDMRATDFGDDSAFAHIQDDAKHHDVPLWRWFLFRSTAASRTARGYLSSASR